MQPLHTSKSVRGRAPQPLVAKPAKAKRATETTPGVPQPGKQAGVPTAAKTRGVPRPTKRAAVLTSGMPTPAKPALLASQLLALMTKVIQSSEPRAIALATELDLSLSQMRAMLALWKAAQPVSLGTLAEAVGISDAAAVRMVDGLLKCGLAVRREDDHDRRIKRIGLTATGTDAVRRLVTAKREGLEALAESLPARDLDRLIAALAPIVSRLQCEPQPRSKR